MCDCCHQITLDEYLYAIEFKIEETYTIMIKNNRTGEIRNATEKDLNAAGYAKTTIWTYVYEPCSNGTLTDLGEYDGLVTMI